MTDLQQAGGRRGEEQFALPDRLRSGRDRRVVRPPAYARIRGRPEGFRRGSGGGLEGGPEGGPERV